MLNDLLLEIFPATWSYYHYMMVTWLNLSVVIHMFSVCSDFHCSNNTSAALILILPSPAYIQTLGPNLAMPSSIRQTFLREEVCNSNLVSYDQHNNKNVGT